MTTDEEPAPFLTALVLAAGASKRMGEPKLLLPLGDRPLLQWVLDAALASRADEVIVVLGHRAEEVRAAISLPGGSRARAVRNFDHASGQSASLRCGLGAADARSDAVAVLLGDQPAVSSRVIDRVAEAFFASGAPIARPVYREAGGAPGHPVVLARRLWPLLAELSGDRGARDLLAAHPQWLAEVPVAGAPPPDVDTPEDYQRVARGYGSGHRAALPSGSGRSRGTR